jgi:hypothetical protein
VKTARLIAIGVAVTATVAAPAAAAAAPHRLHTQTAHQGSLRAQFSFRDTPIPGWWDHGRIKIWKGRRLIVNRVTGNGPPSVFRHNKSLPGRGVTILQLDGTGPPEVLIDMYSGGAHCCLESWIFTGAHRATKVWGHGGVRPALRDVDGKGQPEFHGVDTGFAYLFTSFAGSRFPAKVWNYANGRINDVTRSFPAEVQADMAQQYSGYQECLAAGGDFMAGCVRGALAAYAADGYSLGQGDQAMAVVQQSIDDGQTATETDPFDDFLGKLQQVLRDGGYA